MLKCNNVFSVKMAGVIGIHTQAILVEKLPELLYPYRLLRTDQDVSYQLLSKSRVVRQAFWIDI